MKSNEKTRPKQGHKKGKVRLRPAAQGTSGRGRERVEEALRESEERYRLLFDLSPDAIAVYQEGKLIFVNHAAARLIGADTPEELIGKPMLDFVHPDYRGLVMRRSSQQISDGKAVPSVEEKFLRLDGTPIDVEVTAAPFRYHDLTAIMAIIRDITERKRAEEALERQAEELARLYRASGSLISGPSLDLESVSRTIVETVLHEFGQANCSVFLVEKGSNELKRIAVAGPYADQVSKTYLTLGGPGLVPQAIRTARVINTPDVHAIPAYVPAWGAAQSELTIPLRIGDQVIGAIDVQSAEPNAFKDDDERLMSIFAERAALALEHARLYAQTEQRVQNLASLRAVDMAISSSFDIRLTLGILLEQIISQFRVHAADVLIFDPNTQSFHYSTGQGFRTQALQHTDLRLGDGYAGRAARERQVVTIQDLPRNTGGLQRSADFSREGFLTYVGVPLIAKGQVKGVLEIMQRAALELDQEQIAFLETLAGEAAIAIDNAQLFENLQSSNAELMMAYDETIEGWSRAMDMRDEETEGHTQRVTELTLRLAVSMGFGTEELIHIRRGTLLHDIGKMGVPDNILNKPGPLSEEEWVIMRKHPQLAYDMLAPITYLRKTLDIPYCHHEKWDGTGYPRALKGEQIPLVARIFAVVDVWDALISDRPYRKAWSKEKVLQHIHKQAGKHFDAKVVEVFLKEVPNVG